METASVRFAVQWTLPTRRGGSGNRPYGLQGFKSHQDVFVACRGTRLQLRRWTRATVFLLEGKAAIELIPCKRSAGFQFLSGLTLKSDRLSRSWSDRREDAYAGAWKGDRKRGLFETISQIAHSNSRKWDPCEVHVQPFWWVLEFHKRTWKAKSNYRGHAVILLRSASCHSDSTCAPTSRAFAPLSLLGFATLGVHNLGRSGKICRVRN